MVVVGRAKEVLRQAGVQENEWQSMASVSAKKGSAVELVFSTPMHVKTRCLAVTALNKQYVSGKYAWLDAKKERSEMKPARMMHCVHDLLVDIETSREDKAVVEKDPKGKIVKAGGKRIGFSLRGVWWWTEEANKRYSTEQLKLAAAYVDEE